MTDTQILVEWADLYEVRPGGSDKYRHLVAPPSFWALNPEQVGRFCNGCGAMGSRLPIPDTHWWLDQSFCCNIHDWMYKIGTVERDRNWADLIFLRNMLMNAKRYSNAFMLFLRAYRAMTYYLAVDLGGRDAFTSRKPPCRRLLHESQRKAKKDRASPPGGEARK